MLASNSSAGSGAVHFNGEAISESYSSTSSFSDSYSDSNDLANWEEYVAENGTLFYAEYSASGRRANEKRIEFSRNSSWRLGKKIVARKKQKDNGNKAPPPTSKILDDEPKFSHIQARSAAAPEAQEKHMELVVTAADRYRFGRRSTAVESILGFRVVPFIDQPECLMVDGFVHDMPAMQQQHQTQSPPIKRGDWFKSLDDIDVRSSNVDELLLQFVEPTKVCLKFQGPALEIQTVEQNSNQSGLATGHFYTNESNGSGAVNGSDLRKIENFASFAELFEKLQLQAASSLPDVASQRSQPANHAPFLLLILPLECYQNERHKDSLFFFPEPAANNFLYRSRGSFLTLNAVLGAEMQTRPLSSRFLFDQMEYHVCYRSWNSFLVLFAYAAAHQSSYESNMRTDEIIAYMQFALPSLSLAHLEHNNAAAASLRQFLGHFCAIQRTRILLKQNVAATTSTTQNYLFEDLLLQSHLLPLPKEAQLRIFDALSEMEAMDYRNWNDEPLNTHREFFIHGSVLYYDNFLLAAQLPVEMCACVNSFLRCRGIFDFIATHCVKEIYVWEEIIPADLLESGGGGGGGGGNECGRYFLTICGRKHLILAVVLKIFDAPDLTPDAVIAPSLFYIEEIQETLDHLICCGIESLAMFWSISNKRPEALQTIERLNDDGSVDVNCETKDGSKLEAFIKQKLSTSTSGIGAHTTSNLQRSIHYDEETPHISSSLGGSSVHSLNHSEDDSRAKRLMTTASTTINSNDNASDSGSDWDNFGDQHHLNMGMDAQLQTQMTESLWKEINNILPVKISAGWKNSIFFYVYIDGVNGTVFCSPKPTIANTSSSSSSVGVGNEQNQREFLRFLSEVRKACLIIHKVLQQTKNFRRQLAKDMEARPATSYSNYTNALASGSSVGGVAIKEHGLTIQIYDSAPRSAESNTGEHALYKGNFAVVGRLFQTPMKEVIWPAVLRQATYGTIKFGTYYTLKKIINEYEQKQSPGSSECVWTNVMCAATAGAISSAIANPTDVLKVRMQVHGKGSQQKGLMGCFAEIYKYEGISGLWRGVGPTAQRAVVIASVELPVYDFCKHQLMDAFGDHVANHFISSFIASLCTALASTPIDVIRTRLMNQKNITIINGIATASTQKLYTGSFDCALQTVRNEGFLALYKGFIPTWVRMGPWNIIFFISYEQLKKY